MSKLLGFVTNYTVNHMTSIKPTPSGTINGQDPYPASVKIRSSSIEEVNDEKLGLVDKETNIEFTIYCDDRNLRKFNLWLRQKQKDNEPIIIAGGLPYSGQGKSILTVKSFLSAEEMMTTEDKK